MKKLWVDVINENRNLAKGMEISFVAPKIINGTIVVEIEEEDVIPKLRFLESALIIYVLGGDLSMNVVEKYMMKS